MKIHVCAVAKEFQYHYCNSMSNNVENACLNRKAMDHLELALLPAIG